MNVAGNGGASSSLLPMLPLHDAVAPFAHYVGVEEVAVCRLDSIASDVIGGSQAIYLKVDVQGAEAQVIAGAMATLPTLSIVQLELSLFGLYAGAPLVDEMIAMMKRQGFRLAGLEPGLSDSANGRLLQVDGLFIREDLDPRPDPGRDGNPESLQGRET
jgi:hypothetical protein